MIINGHTDLNGEVAEWSNATVLKTVELKGSVGSNPTLSAKIKVNPQKGANTRTSEGFRRASLTR